MFGQQLVLVTPLQAGGVVADEPLAVKRVGDKLGIEGDVGQGVGVLDPTNEVSLAVFATVLLSTLHIVVEPGKVGFL